MPRPLGECSLASHRHHVFSPPVPLSAHSLSSSLKSISRTVAPTRVLTCTAPRASQARPINWYTFSSFLTAPSLNCSYPYPLFTQLITSACPRPVRCHICKGEGHIASACSTPTSNLVQRWCAILRINNRSQMNAVASTAVGQDNPPRFSPRPSSAVRAVARATGSACGPMPTRSVPSALLTVPSPPLPLSSTHARIGLRTPDSALLLRPEFPLHLERPTTRNLPGHMASSCPAPTTNPNFMCGCFNCGEAGYTAAVCTAPMKHHVCGDEGRHERACPDPDPQHIQRFCEQPGHIALAYIQARVDGDDPGRLMRSLFVFFSPLIRIASAFFSSLFIHFLNPILIPICASLPLLSALPPHNFPPWCPVLVPSLAISILPGLALFLFSFPRGPFSAPLALHPSPHLGASRPRGAARAARRAGP
ncbi:hypothetical protein C8R44DRAFT_884880 [Mycena epipterygia]|nr:hypothetical protein C8R44DRAFT_884880 [Mycena epipterygia]